MTQQETFEQLLEPFSKMAQSRIYMQLAQSPSIQGFIRLRGRELTSQPYGPLAMPFGPGCTYKEIDDFVRSIYIPGYPLTDPPTPEAYAWRPTKSDQFFAEHSAQLQREGYNELERIPVLTNVESPSCPIRIGYYIVNHQHGDRRRIITMHERSVLLCPEDLYSEEKEPQASSITGVHTKGSQYWFWNTLEQCLGSCYSIVETEDGIPFGRLVDRKGIQ